MEDWALIRRLAAEGVSKAAIATRLGISRTTVYAALASDSPPNLSRATLVSADWHEFLDDVERLALQRCRGRELLTP